MFEPKIVDIFCSSMQIYKIGSIIELDDGTKVEIIDVKKDLDGNVIEIKFREIETKKIIKKYKKITKRY